MANEVWWVEPSKKPGDGGVYAVFAQNWYSARQALQARLGDNADARKATPKEEKLILTGWVVNDDEGKAGRNGDEGAEGRRPGRSGVGGSSGVRGKARKAEVQRERRKPRAR